MIRKTLASTAVLLAMTGGALAASTDTTVDVDVKPNEQVSEKMKPSEGLEAANKTLGRGTKTDAGVTHDNKATTADVDVDVMETRDGDMNSEGKLVVDTDGDPDEAKVIVDGKTPDRRGTKTKAGVTHSEVSDKKTADPNIDATAAADGSVEVDEDGNAKEPITAGDQAPVDQDTVR
ncbi:MAG: hypothetical protein ACMVY4_14715 [Minwuia sp.]|uniref:hypothetical protein n=1 Tax=Minwuia sp. TaxID=2493630 RepID=UPI003A87E09D